MRPYFSKRNYGNFYRGRQLSHTKNMGHIRNRQEILFPMVYNMILFGCLPRRFRGRCIPAGQHSVRCIPTAVHSDAILWDIWCILKSNISINWIGAWYETCPIWRYVYLMNILIIKDVSIVCTSLVVFLSLGRNLTKKSLFMENMCHGDNAHVGSRTRNVEHHLSYTILRNFHEFCKMLLEKANSA